MAGPKDRCYLVYALAPAGTSAAAANDALNDYIGDRRRGLVVYHDHFVGAAGGVAVFDVRTDEEVTMLGDPGPLDGWDVRSHPLTFSLTAVGFSAQVDFTLRAYAGTSAAELAATDEPRKRHWWLRSRWR